MKSRKEKLFTGLFIAMVVILAIDTAVFYGKGLLPLGIINSLVLAGIGIYFFGGLVELMLYF